MQVVLNAWGDDLNSRAEERKRSIKGKLASATHMQTVSYIKPLFRKLKRRVCGLSAILIVILEVSMRLWLSYLWIFFKLLVK